MKTFSGLFYDFTSKTEEALNLEEKLEKAKEEAKLLKEEILNDPKLHTLLTTTGIIHDNKIHKKIERASELNGHAPSYYLDVQDYVEPLNSYSLDVRLGEGNE